MRMLTTRFEQVPVAIAKRLAEKKEDAALPSRLTSCAICGKSVRLELCKTNEDGDAVHEDCYIAGMIPSSMRVPTR